MTWLPRDAVERLTKRKRFAAMRRRLDELGIRYTPAADGEPLVDEADLDGDRRAARNRAPRWDRIGA